MVAQVWPVGRCRRVCSGGCTTRHRPSPWSSNISNLFCVSPRSFQAVSNAPLRNWSAPLTSLRHLPSTDTVASLGAYATKSWDELPREDGGSHYISRNVVFDWIEAGGEADKGGLCYTYRGVCRSEYLDDDIVKKRKGRFLAHHPTTMVRCPCMKMMGLDKKDRRLKSRAVRSKSNKKNSNPGCPITKRYWGSNMGTGGQQDGKDRLRAV